MTGGWSGGVLVRIAPAALRCRGRLPRIRPARHAWYRQHARPGRWRHMALGPARIARP